MGVHTKRRFDEIAEQWPSACAEIGRLIGELYAIERLVPGPFPGDAAAQTLRQQLRQERSRPVLDQIWQWATVQVGLPRSEFGMEFRPGRTQLPFSLPRISFRGQTLQTHLLYQRQRPPLRHRESLPPDGPHIADHAINMAQWLHANDR
ncbi:MAG TPA: transposase [Vicinamibacterales bacterium]|nr:transposase [Vicinamibacterales bacterium]